MSLEEEVRKLREELQRQERDRRISQYLASGDPLLVELGGRMLSDDVQEDVKNLSVSEDPNRPSMNRFERLILSSIKIYLLILLVGCIGFFFVASR